MMSFSRFFVCALLVSGLFSCGVSANLLNTNSFNNPNALVAAQGSLSSAIIIGGSVTSSITDDEADEGILPRIAFRSIEVPSTCPDGKKPVLTTIYHTTGQDISGVVWVIQSFEADKSDANVATIRTELSASATSNTVNVDVSSFSGTTADITVEFVGANSSSNLVIEDMILC